MTRKVSMLLGTISILILTCRICLALPSRVQSRQAKSKSINCDGIYTRRSTLVIADVNKLLQAATAETQPKNPQSPPFEGKDYQRVDSTSSSPYNETSLPPQGGQGSDEVLSAGDLATNLSTVAVECYGCRGYGKRRRSMMIFNQNEIGASVYWKTSQRLRRDLEDMTAAKDSTLQTDATANDDVTDISSQNAFGGLKSDDDDASPTKGDATTKDTSTRNPIVKDNADSGSAGDARAGTKDDDNSLSGASSASTAVRGEANGKGMQAKDTQQALGYANSNDGTLDGVPYDDAVEFTFDACSEVEDLSYEEIQTQTTHIWQGHLSPSKSASMCVAANKLGNTDGKLVIEECMFNNDMSQARQLWQLTRQRQQEGAMARISFYLTFLGEPKKDQDLDAGQYSGSHSLRVKDGHLIVSAGIHGQKGRSSEENAATGIEAAAPTESGDPGHVVYLHMGDERVGKKSSLTRRSSNIDNDQRDLSNMSKYEAAFDSVTQARDVVFQPGQF